MTAPDLLLWIARGVALTGFFVIGLFLFELLPERHTFKWIGCYAVVIVSLSLWIGLEGKV